MATQSRVTVLLIAVLLDLALGEPPSRWHPVAWIGRLIAAGRALAPRRSASGLVLHGALVVIAALGISAAAALAAERALGVVAGPIAPLLQGALLKLASSLARLFGAVALVRGHLVAGDLEGARRELGIHLVSRPTAGLGSGAVASAAIESLAENLTDSWVAPMFFFWVFPTGGLAAAWAYRAVNTADAMIGYRDGDLEYLGRAAARMDDALNFIPARLAALSIVAAAGLARTSPLGAWRALRRDARRTASPNAGQTMAAMAGALGVCLEKRGYYRLGMGPAPDVEAIDRAVRVARRAVALSLGAALLALAAVARA